MSFHNQPRRAGGAAGIDNLSCLAADGSEIATKPQVSQEEPELLPLKYEPQELPSFFGLVAENAADPIGRAAGYLDMLARLAALRDYKTYALILDKFVDEARELAEIRKLFKRPSIFSNEEADALDRKAREIHERAELFEREAIQLRTAVKETSQ
jgi:hypothetical protein